MSKYTTIIAAVLILGIGAWLYKTHSPRVAVVPAAQPAQATAPADTQTSNAAAATTVTTTDASNAALDQDLANVDTQMSGLNSDNASADTSLSSN